MYVPNTAAPKSTLCRNYLCLRKGFSFWVLLNSVETTELHFKLDLKNGSLLQTVNDSSSGKMKGKDILTNSLR